MTRIIVSRRAAIDVDDILLQLGELAGPAIAEEYARKLAAIYKRLLDGRRHIMRRLIRE